MTIVDELRARAAGVREFDRGHASTLDRAADLILRLSFRLDDAAGRLRDQAERYGGVVAESLRRELMAAADKYQALADEAISDTAKTEAPK